VEKTFGHNAIGKNVESQLFFTIEIGCPGNTQISGSNRVDNIIGRFSYFTNQVNQIVFDCTLPQMPAKIDLKFRFPAIAHDLP